jgi:hypothetical protein
MAKALADIGYHSILPKEVLHKHGNIIFYDKEERT